MRMAVDPKGEGRLVHFVTKADPADHEGKIGIVTLCGQAFKVTHRNTYDADLALTNRAELCFQCAYKAKIKNTGAMQEVEF